MPVPSPRRSHSPSRPVRPLPPPPPPPQRLESGDRDPGSRDRLDPGEEEEAEEEGVCSVVAEALIKRGLAEGDAGAVVRALSCISREPDWAALQRSWVRQPRTPLRTELESNLPADVLSDARAALRRGGVRWAHPTIPPCHQPPRSSHPPSTPSSDSPAKEQFGPSAGERMREIMSTYPGGGCDATCAEEMLKAVSQVRSEEEWDQCPQAQLVRWFDPVDLGIAEAILRPRGLFFPVETSPRLSPEPPSLADLRLSPLPPDRLLASPEGDREGERETEQGPWSAAEMSPPRGKVTCDAELVAGRLSHAIWGGYPLGEAPVHGAMEAVQTEMDWMAVQSAYWHRHPRGLGLKADMVGRLSHGQTNAAREQLLTRGIRWDLEPEPPVLEGEESIVPSPVASADGSPPYLKPHPDEMILRLGGGETGHGQVFDPGTGELVEGDDRFIGRRAIAFDGRRVTPDGLVRGLWVAMGKPHVVEVAVRFEPLGKNRGRDDSLDSRPDHITVTLVLGNGRGPHGLALGPSGVVQGVVAESPADRAGAARFGGWVVRTVAGLPAPPTPKLLEALDTAADGEERVRVPLLLTPADAAWSFVRRSQSPRKSAYSPYSPRWSHPSGQGDPEWIRILKAALELERWVEGRLSPQRKRVDEGEGDAKGEEEADCKVLVELDGEWVNMPVQLAKAVTWREAKQSCATVISREARRRRLHVDRLEAVEVFDAEKGGWAPLIENEQLAPPAQLVAFLRGQFRRPPIQA
eukprot:Hpha_TRINITY_DN15791_c5_g2::TRINITY_DN15791_c5_g2_i1::g.41550::m.41550